MRLVVLGSGTGVPSSHRAPAGYLVEADGDWMLWDCGPGTLGRIVHRGYDWTAVDHVFLTHHHPDHCADLVGLLFASNWEVARRTRQPLEVIGPAGTAAFVEGLFQVFPGLAWQQVSPRVASWDGGGTRTVGGWTVRGMPVDHANVPAMALRIECGGRTLVYSGDTGETPRIVEAARGADTLVIECSFPDEVTGVRSHLTAGGTGRVAAAAGVRRVVLTHFYPPCEDVDVRAQCAAFFDGEIVLAHDGLVLEI